MTSPDVLVELTQQRYSDRSADRIRRRALERLYARRTAVDQLIDSLEKYQGAQAVANNCVSISTGPRRSQ
jgi:hypothetical protein